jgi:signal transduction histidine kinase
MCELVQQIANLGKPAESCIVEIDLVVALEETLQTLDRFGTTKYCHIQRDVAADLPKFLGDPEPIKQVFRNLMVNAVQAMEGLSDRVLSIGLRVSADGRRLEISVQDTGPGIAPEHLDEIFEPFFTTKVDSKGTGLGLAIVKSVIEHYGGSIQVESEIGKGSCFRFTLPAVPNRETEIESARYAITLGGAQ